MKAGLWVGLTILGWGAWALFEKLAVRAMSPLLVQLTTAYVYSALAPVMYLGMKANGDTFEWSPRGILWTTCASLLATLAGYSFLFAIRERPVSEVMAWTQTYPILTFLLCWLVLDERLTSTKVLGAILIVLGAVLMNK